ncbi:MAG: DUF748 domain-containing protein [Candidatus Rokubacteria bacterium]|nr:DUF748 domain-containing protein [Candidatus Rokubacteria bacterium]
MAQPRPLPSSGAPPGRRRAAPLLRFRPRAWRGWRPGRTARTTLVVIGVLLALIVIGSFLIDEPLRRMIERQMNERMTGYTVRIERLSFHPIGLSLTLYGLTFAQEEYPEPPVLDIAQLDASVEWKALLRASLVANFAVERPKLYVHLQHLREEMKDPTPVKDKGWQDAFEAIYPLEINEVTISNGEATYVDPGPFEPLRITGIEAKVTNIRNVFSPDREYPSGVTARAVVFEKGTLTIDGNADFMKEPHLGIKGDVVLTGVPLDYFKPVASKYDITMAGGTLSAEGLLEYSPTVQVADLRRAEISGVKIDYIHTPKNEGVAQSAAKKTADASTQTANRPDLLLRIKELRVRDSEVGVTNKTADKPFRVFFSGVNLDVENVSNQRAEGVGKIHLTGRFMGSGQTVVDMAYRPSPAGPDFDLVLKLENTDMKAMNPLLRQYGKFDVVEGKFSLYSELHGKGGRVTGYVKPLFKDVKAFDPEQDRDKGFVKRMYERLVTGVSKILKNPPRDEVATKVDVGGRIDQPNTSTLQAIANLLRNAFIEAILPGLEREARSAR